MDQVQKRISKTAGRYLRSGRGRRCPRQRPPGGKLWIAASCVLRSCYEQILFPDQGGAGFSDKLLRSLPRILKPYVIQEKHRLVDTGMTANVWVEPIKVVEVAGAELTVSPVHTVAHHLVKRGGLALRFPRFVRFRDDKRPNKRQLYGKSTICYRPATRKHPRGHT